MTHLLFGLVFLEMALIAILLFNSPLRTLLMMGLRRLKQGRGLLIAGTLVVTMAVIFSAAVYNVLDTQKRLSSATVINPTDEVLMASSLLETSLMGFSLFLGIMIDRLHHYVGKLDGNNSKAMKDR